MAASVHPFSESHADKSNKPDVVVSNVRTSCSTLTPCWIRTQATTVFLCTSSPAHLEWSASMPHLREKARRRHGTSVQQNSRGLLKKSPEKAVGFCALP